MVVERKSALAVHPTLLIVEKNLKVYASKPPVLIFGVLFPLFLFVAVKIAADLRERVAVRRAARAALLESGAQEPDRAILQGVR